MEPEVTSEEKLLKLIRKKNPSAGANKDSGRGPEKKVTRSSSGKKDFDAAKFINGISVLIIVGAAGYIVWHSVQTSFLNKNNLVLEETVVIPDVEPVPIPSAAKSLSYYEEIVAQRDIFNTSFQKKVPVVGSEVPGQAVPQVNPLQHLTLVGVVLDEEPQAIIHNQSTKETLFLKIGDSIDSVVIEDVNEEKVTVRFQDQSIDLTL